MYDQLRSDYESMKRSAIQPANNFYARNEVDLFSNPAANMMDSRDPIRKGNHVLLLICYNSNHRIVKVPTLCQILK